MPISSYDNVISPTTNLVLVSYDLVLNEGMEGDYQLPCFLWLVYYAPSLAISNEENYFIVDSLFIYF